MLLVKLIWATVIFLSHRYLGKKEIISFSILNF